MSSESALILQNAARRVPASDSRRLLCFALCSGELLRAPRGKQHLQVLSGTAWISVAGRDIVVSHGSCVKLVRTRYPTLVSGLGSQPLLFEVW